jgi:flavin prenyltransferase
MKQTRPGGAARQRIVVAVAGGGGMERAARMLERLGGDSVETHLVLSTAAADAPEEDVERARSSAAYRYEPDNQAARISSGSFLTDAMVVLPCDAATARGIVLGLASDLVLRAADVTLKESRPLVLGIVPDAVPEDLTERLAGLPGVSVTLLTGSVDDDVAALLAQLPGAASS